jgi:hypothetical protein
LIFARGVTTVVAVATRQAVGGSVGGFVHVLNALGTIALFGFLLSLVRGLLMGTGLRGLVNMPILIPLGVLAVTLVLVWLLRGLGLRAVGGRLISDDVPDSFTGHATAVWWRYAKTKREWTILERLQPTVVCILGLVLFILPWTRAIGLFFFVVAFLASRRVAAERRVEAQHERQFQENDPYARVLAPKRGEARTPSCKAQLLNLEPAQRALLDEQTLASLEANREQILREEGAVSLPPVSDLPDSRPVLRQERPTVPYGVTSRNILVATLILAANFAAGDIAGLYRFMPAAVTGMVESLDREIAVFQPHRNMASLGTGVLTREFLTELDPDALQERDAQARAAARTNLRATLDAFAEALTKERRTGREQLAVEYHPDAGSPDLDALLLEDDEALQTWTRLLRTLVKLENDHRSAHAFADGIGPQTTGEELADAQASAEALLNRLTAVSVAREALHAKLTARLGRTP